VNPRPLTAVGRLAADDGTVKLIFESPDAGDGVVGADRRPGSMEAVLLVNDKGRATACLSSQVGCAMGCVFCATGRLGPVRDCTAAELVGQFDALAREAADQGTEVTNVVFMGMGEALANLGAVLPAAEILMDQKGRNIFPRRITISTVGHIPGIRRLAEFRPALGLAFSLISAREDVRRALIPSAAPGSLGRVRAALDEYRRRTGKRIVLETVLFDGINDDAAEADAIAAYARGLDCIVNVIPWNPVSSPPEVLGRTLAPPRDETVHRFAMSLSDRGVANTVRYTRGREVTGACGQLGDPTVRSPDPSASLRAERNRTSPG
jgi:23S rRNA (adenine2503-C2)-methyltransferase